MLYVTRSLQNAVGIGESGHAAQRAPASATRAKRPAIRPAKGQHSPELGGARLLLVLLLFWLLSEFWVE